MGTLPKVRAPCSTCGEPLTSRGVCLFCLLRAGLDGSLESAARAFGDFEIARREDGSVWELGRGGMGVTYRAVDKVLHRHVALKIIDSAGSAGSHIARERFLREACNAAALQHPNVASVFYFGASPETERCYLAMELVDGETLEARIRREGPLSVEAAFEIAIQVTRALVAADARGVIHRDLKPSNIMLTPTNAATAVDVKLIDFGLAKAMADAGEMNSAPDGFIGTPAFASPEQFGGHTIDARSDIYSLGITLWYALTGQVPYPSKTIAEIRESQRNNPLPVQQLTDKRIPTAVIDILKHMLAIDPRKRPASAQELLRQLEAYRRQLGQKRRMVLAAAATIALVLALVGILFLRRENPGITNNEKSIAVLPFENLSDDKDNAYFASGVQDEILSNLARIADLKVISRTSVAHYRAGRGHDVKKIGQQLGVNNIVEGSVRKAGNHIRVSVQLIDVRGDRDLWAQNYDRTLADSVSLQGELATEIASGVGATLSPQEKARVQATPTKNTAAYYAYLRGRTLAAGLTTDFSNVESAARAFRQAVTLDPSFALAWAYLSSTDSAVYWNGLDPTPARLAAAKGALDHAIALDPDLPENHLALGYYRYYGLRDFKSALAEFQTAEQGLPNNVDVLKAIGLIQRRFGHWDEAITVLRHVVELDPRNIDSAGILASAYMSKRRFSDALAVSDQVLTVDPSNRQGLSTKVMCLLALGKAEAGDSLLANPGATLQLRAFQALATHRFAEAADLLSKALKDEGDNDKADIFVELGLAQKRAGNVAASKAAFEEAVQGFTQALSKVDKDAPTPAGFHSGLGVAYAGLSDAALAISEGRRGMALQPTSEDPFEGPQREEDMAVIYAFLGDADNAIPILKRWAHVPSSNTITPALMRIDPTWDPIRNDPRFQELIAEKKL